jgi:cytoskeletal protein RodZ
MATAAEQLRAAREAMGLSVHDVAELTKIRTDHIRALEEGNYRAFAAPVYIRGFARTYSRLLHLDADSVTAAIDTELRQSGQFVEPELHPGSRGLLDILMLQFSKVNWRVVLPLVGVLLALVVVILGYRVWLAVRHRDPLSRLGPGLYEPANPHGGETLPLPAKR